jgi:hypothetical protein
MNNHRTAIRGQKNTILYEHFRGEGSCCISHCIVQPIEQVEHIGNGEVQKKRRLEREAFWIIELNTNSVWLMIDWIVKTGGIAGETILPGDVFIRYLLSKRNANADLVVEGYLRRHHSMILGSWMLYVHLLLA